MTFNTEHPETAVFWRRAGDFVNEKPLAIPQDAACGTLIDAMTTAGSSAAIVTDEQRNIAGIVTEQDVLRRLIYRAPEETPVCDIMTKPVLTITADQYLYRAVSVMRRHNLHHIPVIDPDGGPCGMLRLSDALAAMSPHRLSQVDNLSQPNTPDGWREIKGVQGDLADALVDEAIPPLQILSVLSHVNSDLYRQIVATCIEQMAADDWGLPPVGFGVIVMGSGGRNESLLHPDQDNGFIMEDYDDADHDRVDAWFLELADRMTKALDGAGIPLCTGYVMAVNPLWRKTISQWEQQTSAWIKKRTPIAIRLADILFDFDWVYGDAALVDRLRNFISDTTKNSHGFLRQRFLNEREPQIPLGWFGRIKTITGERDRKGQIDIKHAGLMPLTQTIRLLALNQGLTETSTIARIDALRDAGMLSDDMADEVTSALTRMAEILLKSQLDQRRSGLPIDNFISVKALTSREKRVLANSLKAVQALYTDAKAKMTGNVF